MCENRDSRLMKDPVTGKTQKQDPLSKTNISKNELNELMIDTEINAWVFFDKEEYEF